MSTFKITKTLHDDCLACEEAGRTAALYAQVTGSVGGTHEVTGPGGIVQHSATVSRLEPWS